MASLEAPVKTEVQSEIDSKIEIKKEINDQNDHIEETDNGNEDDNESREDKKIQMNVDTNDSTDDNNTTSTTVVALTNNDTNNNDMQMESTSEDKDKTNLIVNYLPQQMTDEEFENLFKGFGPRKSCKIVRNRSTGYSYGFGFVDFETHDQAIRAINDLNGHELDSKRIKVAFARPAGQDIKQANLYVKNVPNDWSQEDVRKVFEPYGDIIQVRVLGNDRGVAFVLFDLRKQAEDALEALNGKKLDNCETPFEIKFAADKKTDKQGNKNGNSMPGKNRRDRGQRGGRNRSNRDGKPAGIRQGDDGGGNQRAGGGYYDRQRDHSQHDRRGGQHNSQYGNNSIQPFNNNMNGYGPVRQQSAGRMNRYAPFMPVRQQQQQPMANPAAMASPMGPYGYPTQNPMIPAFMIPNHQQATMMPQAMQMNHTMAGAYQPPVSQMQQPVGGYVAPLITQNAMNNIYSVASNTMQNAAQMQPQLGQPMNMRSSSSNVSSGGSGTGAYGDDGVTLFVYNIGPNSDEAELNSLFSPYGYVVKCNVVRKTPGGETKGFGFVTLKNKEQANAAISGLNGSLRNGRTLQVSLKK